MPRALTTTAYAVLGAAVLALVALNVLVWSGGLVDESGPVPEKKEAAPQPEPPPPPPQSPSPQSQEEETPAASRRSTSTVVLSAVRGDCWLAVRVGGESGQVLFEGVLAQGDSLRFKRRKLWLRLGAASNLEISVDGKPAEVPPGTVDVVLPVT
jgi:hypothetical protein